MWSNDAALVRRLKWPFCVSTATLHEKNAPAAYGFVKFIVIRAGRARLLSQSGEYRVSLGDVVIVSPNTLYGAIAEGGVSTTTVYLDANYVVDQLFWQYVDRFASREEAADFIQANYPNPVQLIHLGKEALHRVSCPLDELTHLCRRGFSSGDFHRLQALLSLFLDEVTPALKSRKVQGASVQGRSEQFLGSRPYVVFPVRDEADKVASILRERIAHRWTLEELSQIVHLSESQLRRVFVSAFGKTPSTFLAMLRTDRMAALLQGTGMSVAQISREVGWSDASYGASQFRRWMGVTPQEYRRSYRRCQTDEPPTELPQNPGEAAINDDWHRCTTANPVDQG